MIFNRQIKAQKLLASAFIYLFVFLFVKEIVSLYKTFSYLGLLRYDLSWAIPYIVPTFIHGIYISLFFILANSFLSKFHPFVRALIASSIFFAFLYSFLLAINNAELDFAINRIYPFMIAGCLAISYFYFDKTKSTLRAFQFIDVIRLFASFIVVFVFQLAFPILIYNLKLDFPFGHLFSSISLPIIYFLIKDTLESKNTWVRGSLFGAFLVIYFLVQFFLGFGLSISNMAIPLLFGSIEWFVTGLIIATIIEYGGDYSPSKS
jgi:hypothetical protein